MMYATAQGRQNKSLLVDQRTRARQLKDQRVKTPHKERKQNGFFFISFFQKITIYSYYSQLLAIYSPAFIIIQYLNCSEASYCHECTAEGFIFNLMTPRKIKLFFNKQLAWEDITLNLI